jgi:outer membrane biosynthesis protein TonB
MNKLFARHFSIVAIVHGAILVVLLFGAWLGGCFRRKPAVDIPIEFTVDMRVLGPENKPGPPPEPVRREIKSSTDDIPELPVKKPDIRKPEEKKPEAKKPEVKKPEAKKPEVKKPVPKPVERPVERKVVRRPSQPQGTTTKRLSDEEIRRLLALGATPGERDVIPAQSDMYRLMVRNALHDPWLPPDKADVGAATARVRIWIGDGGRIVRWSMEKASGVAALDASVVNVMNSVRDIPGLGGDFINQYRVRGFSVDFQVE